MTESSSVDPKLDSSGRRADEAAADPLAEIRTSSPEFDPPSLRGRHVYLRAVVPDDYGYLYLTETSSELAVRGAFRGSVPGFQDWLQQRSKGALAQFMVIGTNDNAKIGIVTAFSADFQDGHAHLAAAKFNPRSMSPLMVFGFGLFVNYVFRCWNFHKVYLDTAEYNYPQFASGLSRILTLEGRLRQHHFLDGRRWDHLILTIFRDRWKEFAPRFLRAEGLQREADDTAERS